MPANDDDPRRSFKRSPCPIAVTLDVLGDRWTLVIVRDLIVGKRRYGEFLASAEGIPTNILADRLKRMEAEGLVEKRAYQDRPVRYEYRATEKLIGLKPVLWAIVDWGNRYYPGTYSGDELPDPRL